MQTLQSYIQSEAPDRTQAEWAEMLGTSRSYFCEILNGTKRPGPKLINAINRVTGGKVPPGIWFDPVTPADPEAAP